MQAFTNSTPYLKTVALAFGARGFAVLSQLFTTVFLASILGGSKFGDMIVVFATYRLIALSLGTGLYTLLIFNIGDKQHSDRNEKSIYLTSLVLGVGVAMILAIISSLSAPQISNFFEKEGMSFWIFSLSPYLVFLTSLTVTSGYFDGRSKVDHSIVIADLTPNLIQTAGLILIMILGLQSLSTSIVLNTSVAIPALIGTIPLFRSKRPTFFRLRKWDIRYALMNSTTMLSSQQIHGLDLLLIGTFFSSETTGAYAISARIALLIPFVQLILLRKFTPRARHHISKNDIQNFNNELAQLKQWILASVFLLSGISAFIFPLLQNFLTSELPNIYFLILLLPALFVRACFGGLDVALKMSGRSGLSLLLSILGALLTVSLSIPLFTLLGISGLGLALLFSAIISTMCGSLILFRFGFRLVNLKNLGLTLFSILGAIYAINTQDIQRASIYLGLGLTTLSLLSTTNSNTRRP